MTRQARQLWSVGLRTDIVASYPCERRSGTIRVGDLGQNRAKEERYDRECSEDGHLRERECGGTRGRLGHPASDACCNYKEKMIILGSDASCQVDLKQPQCHFFTRPSTGPDFTTRS